jgi:peptidoglycan/xylan/chitin deacetylase (PgdA/CDA1 family)
MNRKAIIKTALGSAALAFGIFQRHLAEGARKQYSMILMYHRIIDSQAANGDIEPGMYIKPKTFDLHLQFLKKYFNVVALEKLYKNKIIDKNSKPDCAITFDDGWLDFACNAFPVLLKHSVPATVFLPTGFIGSYDCFWTDKLAAIIPDGNYPKAGIENSQLSKVARAVLAVQGLYEKRLDEAIKIFKTLGFDEIEKVLEELCSVLQTMPLMRDRAFMNWNEVAEIAKSGLVSFGSHTVHHLILTSLQSGAVFEELTKSKQDLLDHGAMNPEFYSFCYPNGNHNEEIDALTRKAGYHLAVTTQSGWNHANDDRIKLKRIGLHQDISCNEGLLAYRLLSALPRL